MDANERRARATQEATQWWNRFNDKRPTEVSRTDRELFTQWLRESPLHVAELLRVAHVHDALARFKAWSEIEVDASSESHNVIPLRELAVRSPEDRSGERDTQSRFRTRVWAVAACACVVAILAGWFALGARGDVIETELAERRQVMLDDGTVVQLEPETRLQVRFEDHVRRVALEHGRALFRVTKDAHRPFLVSADHTFVRAVGTAFGVENGTRGIVVTVAEGKVAVGRSTSAQEGSADAISLAAERGHPAIRSTGEGRGARSGSTETPGAEVFLTAGQQVTIQDSGRVERVRVVDTARALAWAHGQLVFENDTLADVVAEFNQYNRTQVRIRDPKLAARRVSGVFEATDTETLLAFIRQGGSDVDITHTDEGVIIGSGSR